jgi:hypothetical protein
MVKARAQNGKGTRPERDEIGQRPKADAAAMGVPKGMRQITKRPKADTLQRLPRLLSDAASRLLSSIFFEALPVADSASASTSRNKIVKIMKIFVDIDKIKS